MMVTRQEGQTSRDPLSEAKLYIAYGRHEKALQVLDSAIQADSSRNDLRELRDEIKNKPRRLRSLTLKQTFAVAALVMVGGLFKFLSQYAFSLMYIGFLIQVLGVMYALFCVSRGRKA